MASVLSAREQSDGKRCPNCTSGGQGESGAHETTIHYYPIKTIAGEIVLDVGWVCWNCAYEWGFEQG